MRDVGDVVALDPGIRSPGIALFRGGVLVAAARLNVTKHARLPMGERVMLVAEDLVAWVRAEVLVATAVTSLVYEWPHVYTEAKRARSGLRDADPNDLPPLVGVGAGVAMALRCAQVVEQRGGPPRARLAVSTPEPGEWAGQLPKRKTGSTWASPRGARVESRLSPAERELVPDSHDAVDAVGIGLWYLQRFDRRRVFPGAT